MELLINPPDSQPIFDQLIQQAAETHGWSHQPYDYKYYSEGFDGYWFIVVVDKEKDPSNNFVAGGALARWDAPNTPPLYGIGLFYTKEKYRGQGHGKQIFQKMMDIVGDDNCVLVSAFNMSQKYAEVFGFKEMPSYWHYGANVKPGMLKIPELSGEYTTKNWKDVDESLLDAYDLTICPRDRKKLMRTWFEQDQVYTRVSILGSESLINFFSFFQVAFDNTNQKILGYCTIRVINLNRLSVAPFYAENEGVAARLLADVIREIPDFKSYESLLFLYPSINEKMESLINRFVGPDGYKIGYSTKKRNQFTKKLIESRDDVVYSVACSSHSFV
ncbi:hypothetical protein CRE_23536 [Caenorhabditis remanei]|uniref:N-acetyltransferase domain-containing protein n=1 Tax=Caenorhabditis remanei TaxID=31234 RepID=E3MH90_CAERE|nr:hypothetical protein CRE_23536 [Caenorhabditis remanei]